MLSVSLKDGPVVADRAGPLGLANKESMLVSTGPEEYRESIRGGRGQRQAMQYCVAHFVVSELHQ